MKGISLYLITQYLKPYLKIYVYYISRKDEMMISLGCLSVDDLENVSKERFGAGASN